MAKSKQERLLTQHPHIIVGTVGRTWMLMDEVLGGRGREVGREGGEWREEGRGRREGERERRREGGREGGEGGRGEEGRGEGGKGSEGGKGQGRERKGDMEEGGREGKEGESDITSDFLPLPLTNHAYINRATPTCVATTTSGT